MPTLDTFRPEPGSLPTRDAVPDRYKWDLTSICATWDDWSTGYKRLDDAIAAFTAFQGTLAQGPDRLLAALAALADASWTAPEGEDTDRTVGDRLGSILGGSRGFFRHDPDHWDDLAAFADGPAPG